MNKKTLHQVFKFEDEYLNENKSDFIYGIYRKAVS